MEARDVLRILRQEGKMNQELLEKSALLAGKLLELSGKVSKGDGYEVAMHVVKTKKAWKKMKEIIEAQGGNPNVKEDELPIGEYTFELKATKSGRIEHVNNRAISKVARAAGAPRDKGAGIELFKQSGDKVSEGETIMKIYSESESKLSYAIKAIETFKPVAMDKVLIEEML